MDGRFVLWNRVFPLTLIGEAVFSRFLSALKEERMIASQELGSAVNKYRR